MILILLISVLMIGGILAWILGRWSAAATRVISLMAVLCDLFIVIIIWMSFPVNQNNNAWAIEYYAEWIPQFGISFHLALDGLSLIMAGLTAFIGVLAIACSWNEIKERQGFFHFNLLWNLAGIMGVFLAVDLFLFYFFWEVMLIPMYLLISIWGHENRKYASFKFFIFTQAGGLLMLLAILGLYFINGRNTGVYTFDYNGLIGAVLTRGESIWLMTGFLAAFFVKIPAVPLHNWLPDAHTEAPTAGSVILAGLLLKTGAYGLMRFVLPIFPQASFDFRYIGMALGVIGILYGAKLAFAQTDLKRLIAYTSVSHMGFVMLGIFAMNEFAFQGAMLQMICHALSTGALFILAGAIQERLHTRDVNKMGGFWQDAPRMGGTALFFALASLGLPGLGNFAAEFLVLAGSFQVSVWATAAASLGLIASALYALRIVQKVFHGSKGGGETISDFKAREAAMAGVIIVMLLWIGLYPQPLIDTAKSSLDRISVSGNCILNETQVHR
jgi:NADH-quinone oxidoreductase subunit M